MKKIYLAFTALVMTFASCSMDIVPEGEISDTEALTTVKDYESFTNGLYALMRSVTSGDYVVLSDIQLDDFHAVIGNGNRRMDFYNGSFTPATGEIGSIYAGYYSVISQTNFLLGNVSKKLQNSSLTDDDKAALNKYAATAHFIRAYCYNSLADKFCESYRNSADIDALGKGLSLQLTYSPTSDNTKYPGRSSLRSTYDQIMSDIDEALAEMTASENHTGEEPVANSNYINSDIIKALKARVCLTIGNDADALSTARELAENGRFPLISVASDKSARDKFKDMWLKDVGTEVMWQVQADFTYHGSATGSAFASNTQNSDYVPTHECVWLFDENDVRWTSWFNDQNPISNSGGDAVSTAFMKYPGNSELYAATAQTNYVNKAKPFRISELYLIAAEAAYNQKEEDLSKYYLLQLEQARISKIKPAAINNLSGLDLLSEIQAERHRELMGEGFRLSDLKRWNMGFTRGNVYQPEGGEGNCADVLVSNFQNLHYEADDYRLVWPIPQHEIDANPQLKGQQNPGY